MDDTKDDARYPPIIYGDDKNHQGHGYLNHQKHSVKSSPYSQPVTNEYVDDNDDDGDDDDDEDGEDVEALGDEEEDDDDQSNSMYLQNDVGDNDYEEDDEGDDDDEENHGNNDNNDDGNDEEDGGGKKRSHKKRVEDDSEWHPKKRKLKSLVSAYEVAPRVPAAVAAAPPAAAHSEPKPYFGSRNPLTDWTEHETFFLLDAWGNRFLGQGRKSLRSEQWQEVAEEVSEVSKIERTDSQCRNRLDTLKKKYKKEKTRLAETGAGSSKWVYFKRLDKLLSSPPQQAGLSCGLDSGEYVFMNPRVYLNRANGLDEMRDSPGNSESTGEDDEDLLGGFHPNKRRHGGGDSDGTSYTLLTESFQKFGEIYEKIENCRREQMVELEKMRVNFHRELETQKKQILERLQNEVAKLDQRDNEDNNDPVQDE